MGTKWVAITPTSLAKRPHNKPRHRSSPPTMKKPQQLVDGHAVELWQEGRKIAIFNHEGDETCLIISTCAR